MSTKTNALFIISAFALSGCFGSSSNLADDLADKGEALAMKHLNADPTDPGDPALASGTGTYAGVAGFKQDPAATLDQIATTPEALSDITLTADFDAATAEGTLSNFAVTEHDTGFFGDHVETVEKFDLKGGTIAGNQINGGTIEGNLKTPEGEDYVISGDWDGQFTGEGADGVHGGLQTTLEGGGFPPVDIAGGYVAEKQ